MDIVVERGAGLDVHQETVVATIDGLGITKETRTFGTVTNELMGLRDWLKENGITHVAMESTGIYWKPVFNILEEDFEVILVNARHIKHVPGRKTDVSDSEWLCKLLRNGLIHPQKCVKTVILTMLSTIGVESLLAKTENFGQAQFLDFQQGLLEFFALMKIFRQKQNILTAVPGQFGRQK